MKFPNTNNLCFKLSMQTSAKEISLISPDDITRQAYIRNYYLITESKERGQVNNTPIIKIHIYWGTGRSLTTARNDRDNQIRVISAERSVKCMPRKKSRDEA